MAHDAAREPSSEPVAAGAASAPAGAEPASVTAEPASVGAESASGGGGPRVSVVVPAFNNAPFIEATVDSILAQTFTDFEVVIADHGSQDGTWEVLQRYAGDLRVRLAQTEPGGGAVRNWNAVTRAARGEWIKLVAGDDLIYPQMLGASFAALDRLGDASTVLVATRRDLVDARGKVFVRARGLGSLDGRVDGAEALRAVVRSGTNLLGEPGCVMMRRDALEAAGWWQPLDYYIDMGSYAPVLVQGTMVAVRRSLAAFRVSAGQWSVRLMRSQATEAAAFNRQAQKLAPGRISDADVRLGDARATLMAAKRRLAYLVLGRRMRTA
jgi:hypothetical protein